MIATIQKSVKVATGSKALLGNPFVGDRESIKQAYRQWLWLVHQNRTSPAAAAAHIGKSNPQLSCNDKWIIPSRENLMKKLNELVRKYQDGCEILLGTAAHAEVILSYIQWRSNNP